MRKLAKYAIVPVIHELTDFNQPTQVLCHVFTMSEYLLEGKNLEDLNVTFVGGVTNVLSGFLRKVP
jgi:putrescine carbamoyltransferase